MSEDKNYKSALDALGLEADVAVQLFMDTPQSMIGQLEEPEIPNIDFKARGGTDMVAALNTVLDTPNKDTKVFVFTDSDIKP